MVRRPQNKSKDRKCQYCGTTINREGRNTVFCSVVCQILKRSAGVNDPDGCWVWQGPLNKTTGTGSVGLYYEDRGHRKKKVRTMAVSRAMYIAEFGQPPKGFDVKPTCGTRNCSNPKHLGVEKHGEFMRQGLPVKRSRKAKAAKEAASVKE